MIRIKENVAYVLHWILIIAGVYGLVKAQNYLHHTDHIESPPAPIASNVGDTRFVVLFYPKISNQPGSTSMSKTLFSKHMNMLKNAGYCAVGLQHACNLYYANKLLPEKAVVILLDSSRDTYMNATPVIQQLGLRATVMLDVKAMKHKDRSFMNWHHLQQMQRRAHWDFGISATNHINLKKSLEYLRDCFPDTRICGISGSTDFMGPADLADHNMLFISQRDGNGYNSTDTDPFHLNVLRIKPQQSQHDLALRLSTIFSEGPWREKKFKKDTVPFDWTSTCGEVSMRDGKLELYARPTQSSADAWFAGAHEWFDIELTTKFKIVRGKQFWAYVRFMNEDNYVRLGCDGKRLYLQERIAGAKVRNLKVSEFEYDFSKFHNLRLIIRNRFAIVYLNDQRFAQRPFQINDSLVSGKVGFAILDPSCGIAACEIAQTSIRTFPRIALIEGRWDQETPYYIEEYSDYLSYLCLNDLCLKHPDAERNLEAHKAIRISAAYRGHELIPMVVLEASDLQSSNRTGFVDKLTNLSKTYKLSGLHLDCRGCQDNESLSQFTEMFTALKANLPQSTMVLSVSPKCYETCDKLLITADMLVISLENQKDDLLLDNIARPFRLKTLLRVVTDEPGAFIQNLITRGDPETMIDSVYSALSIVHDHELKGIALCEK